MTWPTKKLGEVLDYEQPGKYIVNSKNYSNDYKTPVLTAGKTFILGNTDEKENVFPAEKLPVIIFDDFTTAIKFVDFPFKVKSSAMKILHAKKGVADIKYLFYFMQTIELNHVTHKRYWISEYSQLEILLPPIAEQKKIVARLERLLGKIKEAKKLREEAELTAAALLPAELHKIFEEGKKKGLEEKEMGEVLDYEQPTKYIVKSTDYSNEYKTPVLTAGKSFIRGYTNEKDNIFLAEKLPVIIFDDFTTAIKFVDLPFKVKSSAMKILHVKKEKADIKFLFYILQTIKLNHDTHKRYWISEYSKIKIPLPSVEEQKKIVARLDTLSDKIRILRQAQAETQNNFAALEQSVLSQAFSGK